MKTTKRFRQFLFSSFLFIGEKIVYMNTFFNQKLESLKEDKNLVGLKGWINKVKFNVFDCLWSVLFLLLLR